MESTSVDLGWLVRHWLADQAELTAVDRFARRHEDGEIASGGRYRDLLPGTPPQPGQQLAFEVDLDACTGCKSCVVACHNLNGLDPSETWRDVGLLVGGGASAPVLQHVTTACHHCLDPACLTGCPVGAYEKDRMTGIVRHLDDQCIGCQYCTLTCPYDVPKYNERLGIVRKCDLCVGRLSAGAPPACAQACPTEAIRVVTVDVAAVAADAASGTFLEGAPDPRQTSPTTRYVRRQPLPLGTTPIDDHEVLPERAHPALVAMLVLTQLSVGALVVGRAIEALVPSAFEAIRPIHGAMSVGAGLLALAVSVLHLGRPRLAWKAVLGLRTSWLSREVVAFGAFAALAVAEFAAGVLLPGHAIRDWLGYGAVASGVAGVGCSVLLYDRTRRPFWRWTRSAWKFSFTAAVLGVATTLVAMTVVGGEASVVGPMTSLLAGIVATKLMLETFVFVHLRDRRRTPMGRTATLLCGELGRATATRYALGAVGGVALPMLLWLLGPEAWAAPSTTFWMAVVLASTCAGEALERDLFFRAVVVPRLERGAAT